MCGLCGESGVVAAEIQTGVITFEPCNCLSAAASREKAERELKEMLAEVQKLREAG